MRYIDRMSTETLDLTIVIPCYNEEAVIPHLAEVLARFAEKAQGVFKLQLVFVDDGSSDETARLIKQHFPEQQLARHVENQGIGAAILTGLQSVQTPYVAVIDSDCTFDPMQLLSMAPLMNEGVDVVHASPTHPEGEMRGVPGWRVLMSKGAAWVYRRVMRQKLSSATSCFRLMRTQALTGLRLQNFGFSGVTEILLRLDRAGASVVEYPAVLEVRQFGQSKISTLRTIGEHLNLVKDMLRWKWTGNPLQDQALPRCLDGD